MKADKVYRNRADDRRARVYKHESGEGWDFDIFRKHALGGGWSVDAAVLTNVGESPVRTRKEALEWIDDRIGELFELRTVATVTEGWPEKEPPKPTKDAAIKIEPGQIWRQGTRKLIVEWVSAHWNKQLHPDALEVGCRFVTASGRETGRMIRGRKSASVRYHEQRFREKFRFVCEPADAREHGIIIEGL